MKKIITVIMLLSIFYFEANAQIGIGIGNGGFGLGIGIPINSKKKEAERKERMEAEVQQLKNELTLSDEQVIKVRGLFIERDRSRERNARKSMTREQFNERMREILTEEQFSKYLELRPVKTQPDSKEEQNEKKKAKSDSTQWDDVYR